jgi:hypothetical protein
LLENQIELLIPVRVRRDEHATGAILQGLIYHFPTGASRQHGIRSRNKVGWLCLRITCPRSLTLRTRHALNKFPGSFRILCTCWDGERETTTPVSRSCVFVIRKCSDAPFHARVIIGNLKISVGVSPRAVEFQLAVVAKDVHEHGYTIAHEQVIGRSTELGSVVLQRLPATVAVNPHLDPFQGLCCFRRIDNRIAFGVNQRSTVEICPEWVEAGIPEREEGDAIIGAICILLIQRVGILQKFIPGFRRIVGIEAGFLEELLVPEQDAYIGLEGDTIGLTFVKGLVPSPVVELVARDSIAVREFLQAHVDTIRGISRQGGAIRNDHIRHAGASRHRGDIGRPNITKWLDCICYCDIG